MKISVSLNRTIFNWGRAKKAHEEVIVRTLNPTLEERKNKEMQIQPSSAEQVASYFKSKGLAVELEYTDVLSQAKMTYWQHVLTHGPQKVERDAFNKFIKSLGIQFRKVQEDALFKILNSAFAVNAKICGAGKTLDTLASAFFYHKTHKRTLNIIAAPPSCMSEYRKELKKFRGFFEDLSFEEIYGDSVEIMQEKIYESKSDIIVVSLASLEKLVPVIQDKIANFDGHVTFIIEEGHYIKEICSGRSRAAQMIAPLAHRVIVNTATPMPKGPTDVRGLLALVGIPQPPSEYELGIPARDFNILSGVTYVCDEEDLNYAPMKVEHLDYRDLHELTGKLRSVTMDEIRNGFKAVVFVSTNAAARAVWETFPDVEKTILSGSFFVNDCGESQLKNGRDFEAQRHAINQFNEDERCKILIANYRVGSTGVNLQNSGARLAFFYEISNNGADFFQARYRIRRPNVTPRGGFRYIFARNTNPQKRRTEERQFAKIANQRAVLSEIKRLGRVTDDT